DAVLNHRNPVPGETQLVNDGRGDDARVPEAYAPGWLVAQRPVSRGGRQWRRPDEIAADKREAAEQRVGVAKAQISAKGAVVEAGGFERVGDVVSRRCVDQGRRILVELCLADAVETRGGNNVIGKAIAHETGAAGVGSRGERIKDIARPELALAIGQQRDGRGGGGFTADV